VSVPLLKEGLVEHPGRDTDSVTEEEKTWNFDEWAHDYDGWVSSDDPIYARYDAVLAKVAELCGAAPGKRVLDIGTGTGNLALSLLDRGATVVGLDPSRKMLDIAAEKLKARAGLELQQVTEPFMKIPFGDNEFDAVVSTYSFHHVHPGKKRACIIEMLRVLKPGGVWVIGDLIFQDEDEEREVIDAYDWMEDEYYARIDELLPLFRNRGIVLKSEQYTMITWIVWAVKPDPAGEPSGSNTS
jgi:putative AdoMet-dependent methyltransferase